MRRQKRVYLPQLGNILLGNIYQAVTGTQTAVPAITHRAVANGLFKEDFEIIASQCKASEDLAKVLFSISFDHLNKGSHWSDLGIKHRAKDHYLESALWGLYAELLSQDADQQKQLRSLYTDAYLLATAYFDHPTEAIEIVAENFKLKGYMRYPVDHKTINNKFPCTILFNSLGSSKEELYYTENSLLSQGIATLSFDYPGLHEYDNCTLLPFNIDELTSCLITWICRQPQIDTGRLCLYGISLGARIALYAAIQFADLVKATIALSSPLELNNNLDLVLPCLYESYTVRSNVYKTLILDFAKQSHIADDLHRLKNSLLVVGGGKDLICLPAETKAIYEGAGAIDKKLMLCPNAGHNCYEMMPSLRYEIAQWLEQRI